MSFPKARFQITAAFLAVVSSMTACAESGKEDETPPPPLVVPETYTFESQFNNESSVSYTGQIVRQTLINDLVKAVDGLTERIDTAALVPVTDAVVAELNYYFAFDSETSGDQEIGIKTKPGLKQKVYNDISTGKDLKGKIAGGTLLGWDEVDVTSAESLVAALFTKAEQRALEHAYGVQISDATGNVITNAAVLENGIHLGEMIGKFLHGAVSYSQVSAEYLSDSPEEGLLSDNTKAEEGKPYTPLEHHWDEAFGYFGASRDYGLYTDVELAGSAGRDDYKTGYHDTDGDGSIDLGSEYNFSTAKYAARRDAASVEGSKTNFGGEVFKAFVTGRAIITSAKGALTEKELTDLKTQRDLILQNWEKVLAASTIHYINDVFGNYDDIATAEGFVSLAEHWSEMKGFALSLQFNPRKIITDAQLADVYAKMGQSPVLESSGIEAYKAELLAARATLKTAYGFADANVEAW